MEIFVVLTFWAFLLELHLPAVLVQLLICEFVEGVWSGFSHNNTWLVLLLNNGFRCGHQLPLEDTRGQHNETSQTTLQKMTSLLFLVSSENI